MEESHFGILAIASDPMSRRSGVGKLLMTHSEKYASDQNFKKMYLTVNPKNITAIKFFEDMGWTKDGNVKNWQGHMKKEIDMIATRQLIKESI